MTTLLTRLVAVLERGVIALERIADATESIAVLSQFHEAGHALDNEEPRPSLARRLQRTAVPRRVV